MLRQLKKNVGFWITTSLIVLIYLFTGIQLYFLGNIGSRAEEMMGIDLKLKYASTFHQASGNVGLMIFIIALIVGAGSIAADNKANALMVYLSKPITKSDYLLGKWMGIFLVLFLANLCPALLLYLYCLTSYLSDGFLKNEPTLILKVVATSFVPAVIHASVLVGCSAWSKAPRNANIFYAAFYFLSIIMTGMVFGIFYRGDMQNGFHVFTYSLSGVINTINQNIYHVNTSPMKIPPPALAPALLLASVLIIVGIASARAKINAVEVVKG
jgi:ABC-2 type transport system permease protein